LWLQRANHELCHTRPNELKALSNFGLLTALVVGFNWIILVMIIPSAIGFWWRYGALPSLSANPPYLRLAFGGGTVLVFRHDFALEDAIGSHACSKLSCASM
jgi:hypothetical protein